MRKNRSFPVPDRLVQEVINTDLSQVMNKIFEEDEQRHNKGGGIQLLTYGVVKASEYIAKDLKLTQEDTNLAKLIALLHDIGRFKQIELYNNFMDNMENNDHADYGVKILFRDNLIRNFITDNKYDSIIYKAIFNHNKYKIENGLNERELLHAKLKRNRKT